LEILLKRYILIYLFPPITYSQIIEENLFQILYSCYILGYQPDDYKTEAFKKSAEIIIRLLFDFVRLNFFYATPNKIFRDFPYMTGLSIIQSCLALSFYKSLPEVLIHKVFSIDFIRRLEQEIKMCYSKV
jgi:hypothetical protein